MLKVLAVVVHHLIPPEEQDQLVLTLWRQIAALKEHQSTAVAEALALCLPVLAIEEASLDVSSGMVACLLEVLRATRRTGTYYNAHGSNIRTHADTANTRYKRAATNTGMPHGVNTHTCTHITCARTYGSAYTQFTWAVA